MLPRARARARAPTPAAQREPRQSRKLTPNQIGQFVAQLRNAGASQRAERVSDVAENEVQAEQPAYRIAVGAR
jgi:hypothetical protein